MEIQAAISSLSAIKAIADGLISMRDETKVLEIKLALMQRIFEIRQVLDALQEETATVKQENRNLKEQASKSEKLAQEREGYEPFEVTPGCFVAAAKSVDGRRPKPPYYCQSCLENSEKSIFSYRSALGGPFGPTLECPANQNHKISLERGTSAEWLSRET